MYRIITVDLDGTLLSPENKITKYTEKIIKLLINKGLFIVFASGRHHIDMMYIRDNLNIRIFMITSNGAKVYNLDNKLIFENNLDVENNVLYQPEKKSQLGIPYSGLHKKDKILHLK